ncbi:hypothetical protein [Opitutus terrae]|uniref:PEP-CTERM system associated protein n=1 Tax=Opitutus terrae (strain DSM 11246 / JCM 15787 / PB90-1) TaxID=452637 RepID=B1ZZ72_OPITP|nr:hypothetical protein [Opitutus terrae]ACB77144.1 hypothetical protein Oter_3870 [Opitutus terrae PB90-1]
MTFRRCLWILAVGMLALPSAHALFNLNQGKDLIFVSGTYTIGYDSNVFTRASGKESTTQTASLSIDYARQAGLIGVTANLSATSGRFENTRGQNFNDPSLAVVFRKRYGRTTGALMMNARRESQPDPDVGQRTQSWNYSAGLDLRYPVNDRYYFTNSVRGSSRAYTGTSVFPNLRTYQDSLALNYVYSSKLDLNAGYSFVYSDGSSATKSYDQSFTFGATGSILPKLSGTIRIGVQQRDREARADGREKFSSFTSGTTLRWLLSRKVSFNFEFNDDYSTSATDISVNRTTAGLHASFSISNKYAGSAGFTYSQSDFLGLAGDGRHDELLQFDASIGVALTTRIRTTFAYDYSINYSTLASADYDRHHLGFSLIASY